MIDILKKEGSDVNEGGEAVKSREGLLAKLRDRDRFRGARIRTESEEGWRSRTEAGAYFEQVHAVLVHLAELDGGAPIHFPAQNKLTSLIAGNYLRLEQVTLQEIGPAVLEETRGRVRAVLLEEED